MAVGLNPQRPKSCIDGWKIARPASARKFAAAIVIQQVSAMPISDLHTMVGPSIHAAMITHAREGDILAEATSRGAALTRVGGEWVGPCPLCGGRDRFSINPRKRVFNCRGCQFGGDVINLVRHLDACDFDTAVSHLAGAARMAAKHRSQPPRSWQASRAEHPEQPEKTKAAVAIWEAARCPIGTAGELYLNRRGLQIPAELAGNVLRFHDGLEFDGRQVPGLVALFRDVLTDEPTAIQRIFLQANGARIDRRMLGRVRRAAIKLDADAEVAEGLHIGEGLETCIAARALGFKPVWAVGSNGGIRAFPVLPGIEALSVLGETDDHGANERAAQACATRWLGASREVLAVVPLIEGDMNDVASRCGDVL